MEGVSSRTKMLSGKVIFVDGLAGSGKTMLAPIISTLDRVELMTYAFDLQHYCNLYFLREISLNGAMTLVKLAIDLKLYDSMMGRGLNFRPSDLSSVLKDMGPIKYIQRLFEVGDEAIPEKIKKDQPIMNFLVHNLLPFAKPIFDSLGDQAHFFNVVRHPLYMIKQQALNMTRLINNSRNVDVYINYKGKELPFYTSGWEEEFIDNTSPYDRAVLYMKHLLNLTEQNREKSKVFDVCFEKFVLSPESYLNDIYKFLGTQMTNLTLEKLRLSHVPREKVSQSVDLEIYRRCGWTAPIKGMNERDELNLRYEDCRKNIKNKNILNDLNQLIEKYEKEYWAPELFNGK